MICEALTCITEELNEYFRDKLSISEEKIVLSGLMNMDGTIAVLGENKIVVTLVNLENETVHKLSSKGNASAFGTQNPSLQMNAYVLFSAYFSTNNYAESLRFISFIIAYFQSKNVFTKSNTPNMDSRLEKLSLEIFDLSTDSLSNMWSSLGAKYMPSVLYKMRILTFDESTIRDSEQEC